MVIHWVAKVKLSKGGSGKRDIADARAGPRIQA